MTAPEHPRLPPFGAPLDAEALRRLAGHPDQLLTAELLTRGDGIERGVRVVRIDNGEIAVEVVVDRALDLGRASVRGVPVAWPSPTGIAGPRHAEPHGHGPQRTFFGGLLTTCGLDHFGAPAERSAARWMHPPRAHDTLPLHGRLSGLPARLLGYGLSREHDPGELFVEGEVRQASLFGEVLVPRRRISLALGSRTLALRDTVTNAGYAATPHALLYHVNVGWPVVAPGARIAVSGAQDGDARPLTRACGDADPFALTAPPSGSAEEQVSGAVGAGGGPMAAPAPRSATATSATAAPSASRVGWDPRELPNLLQWRIGAAGHYAVALEPASSFERRADGAARLPLLEPGASVERRLLRCGCCGTRRRAAERRRGRRRRAGRRASGAGTTAASSPPATGR